MRAYERLIQYARIHTASSEEGPYRVPSTERQFDLGRLLVQQMQELGVTDARIDEHCYVYGSLPATPGYEQAKKLGFIAHMDTIPDFSGENVQPTLVEKYAGGDIPLGSSGRVLSPKDFPSLDRMIGRTLIVTDGTTVLGGDDKAGVAEIMTLNGCKKKTSPTDLSALPLPPMKRSARERISLTFMHSAVTLPIRWMEEKKARSSLRTSMPPPLPLR